MWKQSDKNDQEKVWNLQDLPSLCKSFIWFLILIFCHEAYLNSAYLEFSQTEQKFTNEQLEYLR